MIGLISVDPDQPASEGAVCSGFTQIASPSRHSHVSLVKQVSKVSDVVVTASARLCAVRGGGDNPKLQ